MAKQKQGAERREEAATEKMWADLFRLIDVVIHDETMTAADRSLNLRARAEAANCDVEEFASLCYGDGEDKS